MRVAVVAGLLVLAFVVSRSCQQDQVRITEEQAIATAKRQVDFAPTRTQVRFLRQGLNSRPYWIVSLSIARRGNRDLNAQEFAELAVVRVEANTGKVADVKVQR